MDTSKGWTPSVPSRRACDRSRHSASFSAWCCPRHHPIWCQREPTTSLINLCLWSATTRHQTYARGGFCHGLLRQGKSAAMIPYKTSGSQPDAVSHLQLLRNERLNAAKPRGRAAEKQFDFDLTFQAVNGSTPRPPRAVQPKNPSRRLRPCRPRIGSRPDTRNQAGRPRAATSDARWLQVGPRQFDGAAPVKRPGRAKSRVLVTATPAHRPSVHTLSATHHWERLEQANPSGIGYKATGAHS